MHGVTSCTVSTYLVLTLKLAMQQKENLHKPELWDYFSKINIFLYINLSFSWTPFSDTLYFHNTHFKCHVIPENLSNSQVFS
jgi:hypothetical protein